MLAEFPARDEVAGASYAVILGLCYVGLPLAQQALRSGVLTVGLDASRRVID